jgi:isocitrate lyase
VCCEQGGKVLVSTQEHIDRLNAARLQCDIMGTNTLIVSRTDAEAANLVGNNNHDNKHAYAGSTEHFCTYESSIGTHWPQHFCPIYIAMLIGGVFLYWDDV